MVSAEPKLLREYFVSVILFMQEFTMTEKIAFSPQNMGKLCNLSEIFIKKI